MATLSDKLHVYSDLNQYEYAFRVRTPFTNTWEEFVLADFTVNRANDHVVGQADFVVRFATNKFTATDIASYIPEYAEVEFIVTTRGTDGTAFGEYSRREFHGHMYRAELERDRAILKCFDPLMALSRTYVNYGTFAADVEKIEPQETIPTPPEHVPDSGIFAVEITENSESRWVIPNELAGVDIVEYQDAYVGGASDEAYSGVQGGVAFKAGLNRRQWRVIARVWDTGMDLDNAPNDFGQKISYDAGGSDYSKGNPIPNDNYQIGTDLGNYLEFIDYTPVGDIYIEFVEVYIEGTNDIEQIFIKAVNPRVTGRCSTGSGVGTVVSFRSRFIRDGILVGGKIKVAGTADGTAVNITGVTDQNTLTTDGATAWADEVEFEIFNAVEHAPRWVDGTHYDATSTDYDLRTVWPSLVTINVLPWNQNDGSTLKLLETILNENAPPNYRIWYDPFVKMVRLQYVAQTPWNITTPNYEAGSFPYGAFTVTGALPGSYDAEDDFHQLTVQTAGASPRDEDTFYSQVIVEGTNERASSILKEQDVKIYTWPPGDADPAGGWEFGAGALAGTWKAIRRTGDGPFYTYANLIATDYIDIKDNNIDTIIGWYRDNPDEDELNTFAPYMVIDLGQMTEVGHARIYTPDTRRDFQWGVRLEACDENGLATTSGQTHYNPAAAWQLMHPDWYNQRVSPMQEYRITQGWIKNRCRYVLISMTWAKVHLRFTHNLGLADVLLFTRDVVTGSARIVDLGARRTRGTLDGIGVGTVTDSTKDFVALGVQVGDEIFNATSGFRTTVASVAVDTLGVDAVSGYTWSVGDQYMIRPWTHRTGIWDYTAGTGLDDATFRMNMPILYQQTVAGNWPDWLAAAPEWITNHRTAYYQDHSISHTENCALRAAEILLETVRNFQSTKIDCRWHSAVDLYHTIVTRDPRTGISLRALVESITWTPAGLSLEASTYADTAWTGERPEAIPA